MHRDVEIIAVSIMEEKPCPGIMDRDGKVPCKEVGGCACLRLALVIITDLKDSNRIIVKVNSDEA